MPTYDFHCPACNRTEQDVMRPLSEYGLPCPCPVCEAPMYQLLSAPHVVMDYQGYTCPVSGEWIEGRRAHRENLKKQGCRVYEPGETELARKRAATAEADFDRSLDNTIDELLHHAGSDKVEKLCNEVASGVTATVERLPFNR